MPSPPPTRNGVTGAAAPDPPTYPLGYWMPVRVGNDLDWCWYPTAKSATEQR